MRKLEKFLENLKTELDEFSDMHPVITVSRSDLEKLIQAYEQLKFKEELIRQGSK